MRALHGACRVVWRSGRAARIAMVGLNLTGGRTPAGKPARRARKPALRASARLAAIRLRLLCAQLYGFAVWSAPIGFGPSFLARQQRSHIRQAPGGDQTL